MSKIGLWDTTAANNNSAPPDGFPEGQAPSTYNDGARELMAAVRTYAQDAQWFDHGMSPTFVNANSFTVPGNQLSALEAGRHLKLFDGTTIFRSIATASFTTVTTVSLGAGTAITSSLSSFAVSILSPSNTILPDRLSASSIEVTTHLSAAAITVTGAISAQDATIVGTITAGSATITTARIPTLSASSFVAVNASINGLAADTVSAATVRATLLSATTILGTTLSVGGAATVTGPASLGNGGVVANTSGYLTVINAIPRIELHKPGFVAFMFDIDAANALAIHQTFGNGGTIGGALATLDAGSNLGISGRVSAGNINVPVGTITTANLSATTILGTTLSVPTAVMTTLNVTTLTAASATITTARIPTLSASNVAAVTMNVTGSLSAATIQVQHLSASVIAATTTITSIVFNAGSVSASGAVNAGTIVGNTLRATTDLSAGTANIGGVLTVVNTIRGKNGLSTAPSYIMDAVDLDTGFYWIADGIIGFATNGAEGARLSSGGFLAAAFTVSDETIKHEWQPLSSDFVKNLATLRSGTFAYKDRTGRHVGVGAQSLYKILPEAVNEKHDDGLLVVQYGNAALVACVELAKEVMALRAEVALLKTYSHTHY